MKVVRTRIWFFTGSKPITFKSSLSRKGRIFFSEEKKQKTFVNLVRFSMQRKSVARISEA